MGMSENENARGTEGFRKLVCVREGLNRRI